MNKNTQPYSREHLGCLPPSSPKPITEVANNAPLQVVCIPIFNIRQLNLFLKSTRGMIFNRASFEKIQKASSRLN